MRHPRHVRLCSLLIPALIAGACQRQPEAPAVQVDSGIQPRMEPITVEGCLKGGVLADDTWVVLGRHVAIPSEAAATYQLVNADAAMLRAHQNTQVRVSGTLETDRRVVTSTGMVPEDDKARGTSGTPTVGATAAVDLRRLRVEQVTPTGQKCE
jgi:hypothetical protein